MPTGGADANETLARWKRLIDETADCADLVAAVAACDVTDAASLSRVRERWDAELVSTAIDLARARVKARIKFPGKPDIVADVPGVEQATGELVAAHKTRRFAACLPRATPVFDLCCGIGGDAMSLAAVADVTAVDVNPLRAWMTERNAGCATRVADVEQFDARGVVFHLDPARRDEPDAGPGRRRWRYEDYRPGAAFIDRLLAHCPDGAIKLGPGVDLESLPVGPDREIEIINDRGALVQAVLWCGRLASHPGRRTATLLPDGLSFTGTPQRLEHDAADGFGRYVLLVDPAIERAGLTGPACDGLRVAEAHAGLGILTSDDLVDSPWLEAYEVLAQMPWREARVKDWLRDHDAGLITVRTRDKAVETDRAQKRLRGSGVNAYTVFGLRLGKRIVAVITRVSAEMRHEG